MDAGGCVFCTTSVFRVGPDCSIRCELAGKRNLKASIRCTWFVPGSAIRHESAQQSYLLIAEEILRR